MKDSELNIDLTCHVLYSKPCKAQIQSKNALHYPECPTAEFAKKHGLLEVMPALCNPDFTAMELIHARLVRTTTCANGCKCDYTICGDRDEDFLREHPEYKDEAGYRRNR